MAGLGKFGRLLEDANATAADGRGFPGDTPSES